jgi:hypothetical protein
MEPEWTKGISNNTICNTYYLIFIFTAIAAVIAIISAFILPFLKGLSPTIKIMQGIALILNAFIAGFMSLIAYLLCDRALKPQSRIF